MRSSRELRGVNSRNSTAFAIECLPFFRSPLRLNLNQSVGARHSIVFALPLALHFDSSLWCWFPGVAEIQRLERVCAPFRKHLNVHRRLLICRSIGGEICM